MDHKPFVFSLCGPESTKNKTFTLKLEGSMAQKLPSSKKCPELGPNTNTQG